MAILTPAQSKEAREALGLSQSKVARETGINRSTLALFEVNKYLLDDDAQHTLRDFYEAQGHTFAEDAPAPPVTAPKAVQADKDDDDHDDNRPSVVDGFTVLSGFSRDEVEAALDEIHANDEAIAAIVNQPVKHDWWTGNIDPKAGEQALTKMARNYALIRQLQGRVVIEAANDGEKPQTEGEVLLQRLTASTGNKQG